ncbi:TlpA family protein disulfide reductase [Confluentibacter lentus]|uniref:TlpA family protein disulfide reductase n=1 Tax=Confluentibacter lentus TaxID=1699412 RepID=UPI000C281F67|nr:TlpA disulfide reductase family protein [Confluentibacter lentus]
MKTLHLPTTVLLLILLLVSCQKEKEDLGLDIGELHISKTFPKPGDSLKLSYSLDENSLEDDSEFQSLFYYLVNENMYPEDINLKKADNGNWEGYIKIPDSAKALAFNFKSGETYYNNKNSGYTIFLYDENQKQIAGSNASLGYYYLRYADSHGINIDKEKILALLKTDIDEYPEVKDKLGFVYFNELIRQDNVSGKMVINEEIDKLKSKTELTEKDYSTLINFYGILRERGKADSITNIAIERFPNGNIANSKFLNSFFEEKDLEKMVTIFEAFSTKAKSKNDLSIKDYMAQTIANKFFENKDKDNFFKYSALISNKSNLAMLYNNTAWGLVLKNQDLDFASNISNKSLELIKESEKSPFTTESQHKKNTESAYFTFADTYAYILFKQGKMEEAIKYQEPVAYSIKKGKGDNGVIERYVEFLLKNKQYDDVETKAANFIKDGNGSAKTKEYLKQAYVANKGSDKGFNDYLSGLEKVAEESIIAELRKKMIDEEAPDFTLTNLNNEEVTLSSLKGKTVIIDFWATWCGPCIQSFPAMQTAVNKYKDDPNVVFLFVDTWENGTPEQNTKNVTNFIKNNKYSFNVLFDTKTSDEPDSPYKVVEDYKVSGIPTKFIIGTDGKIKFKSVGYGGSVDGLVSELDQMIKFNQSFKPLKS